MSNSGFSEVECGLQLSSKELKNKKLVLIRHPKDLNIAEVFQDKKIKVPKRGVLSEPLLETEGGTHSINYKLMVDRDPIHNTFRPIIKGELGPAFDSSISIVKCVEAGASTKTTPAITAYTKVPQVQGLKPCLLPLGSIIKQDDFNDRVAKIEKSTNGESSATSSNSEFDVNSATPDKKKKKRKSDAGDLETPSTKQKKDKKSKNK